jgi:hypothetical protein
MEWSRISLRPVSPLLFLFVIAACTRSTPAASSRADLQIAQGSHEQVILGRQLVISHDCGGCHASRRLIGGRNNPAAEGWLAGAMGPQDEFQIGACSFSNPNAKPCFTTRARNLTPDNSTGLGRFTERQIFNALRYGLRPEDTPDVDITSTQPGEGNFPSNPHYLAPPMPWPSWRHMHDGELQAIAAYLHRGLKPFSNKVPESEGPPDFWASEYVVAKIGPYPAQAYPTAIERMP